MAAVAPPAVASDVHSAPANQSLSAADLRVVLNKLLQEHVYLAARATGAAIGGRQAEFEAAAASLDGNSVDLSKAIGLAYGADAERAFLPLWRAHIGMFVDYTQGAAAGDDAKKQKALADLTGYANDFDAFLSGANENLPKGAVASLLKPHVGTLTTVIDAQKAGDQAKVYGGLREAMGHMMMIADPLAAATAKKFPEKFAGQSDTPGATLRVGLNNLLAEHVFLASSATAGALANREAQFKSAAAELDGNSVDLSKAIGSVYGADAERTFLPLWRAHIDMFVDYTTGVATNDAAKKQKAVSDLDGYRVDFDAFISGANPNLPKGAVAELLKPHIGTLASVVDAQAAQDWPKAYASMREAGAHMQMIADPLADAIVKQFPEKQFPEKFGAAQATAPTAKPAGAPAAAAPKPAGAPPAAAAPKPVAAPPAAAAPPMQMPAALPRTGAGSVPILPVAAAGLGLIALGFAAWRSRR